MGHARGPARGRSFLRGDAGNAHAFRPSEAGWCRSLPCHRGEQGVAQALRATGIGALAVEHVDTELGGILARRVRKFIDHASTAQKVQPGATDRSCPTGWRCAPSR